MRAIERMQDRERPKYREIREQALIYHWNGPERTQYVPFPPAYASLEARILAPYAGKNYLVLAFIRAPAESPVHSPDVVRVDFDDQGQMRVRSRGFRAPPSSQGRARGLVSPPRELHLVSTQGESARFEVIRWETWRSWYKYERGVVVLRRTPSTVLKIAQRNTNPPARRFVPRVPSAATRGRI